MPVDVEVGGARLTANKNVIRFRPSKFKMDPFDFDAVIVGGGLVGLGLARALAGAGLKLGLVERSSTPVSEAGGWDSRVYAISPASELFLRRLGAWPVDESRIATVTEMRIYGDRPSSKLRFSAYDAHVARLATIVENSVLQTALRSAVGGQQGLTLFSPARCASVEWGSDHTVLQLDGGEALRAKLVVAADGGDSWLRGHAGIQVEESSYHQSAIVANFSTERPHNGVAFQWFRTDGVLALLPLPGDRASMVWSARQDLAERLLSMNSDDLCAEVSAASRDVLGGLALITLPTAFPLRLIRVGRLIAARLALVGDAAHNLHPLAGQGVNLGFQDARELASVLAARGPQRDAGNRALLRRYERARREDILTMTIATHGLQRLFNNRVAPLAWMRNLGLDLTDRMAPIKAVLVRHALG